MITKKSDAWVRTLSRVICLLLTAALSLTAFVACQPAQPSAPAVTEAAVSAAPTVEPAAATAVPVSSIEGKNYLPSADILCFGAQYFSGDGQAVVDYIAATEGCPCSVDAIADATIAGSAASSYAERAKALTGGEGKLLIVELTANDLAAPYEIGKVKYTYDESEYDTDTILGALDFLFQQAFDAQMCAVMITEPGADGDDYKSLYQAALELQKKWGFGIIDMNAEEAPADVNRYVAESINDYLIDIKGDYEKMFQYAGNLSAYDVENAGSDRDSPLKGKHIIYLGSSVTLGMASDGISFVDYIADRSGSTFTKEAANGTSLCNFGPGASRSYIERMKANLDPNEKADLFICQLSTNDASKGAPFGEISASDDPADFDLGTIAGGMEYIITYARDTWKCPIMFYTGTENGKAAYRDMVDLLYKMQEKYDIGIIDLYHNLDVNVPEYKQYMADGVHPTKRGYLQWWTPYMETCIRQFMQPDKATFDFTNFKTIKTEGVLDTAMTFSMLPSGFNDYIPAHRGTKLFLRYTTDAYEDGKTYDKFCRVYLPYGYDPDDKDTKYNVMYLQHGNGNSPNTLLDAVYNSTKNTPANGFNLLNNLFDPDNKLIDPFIIICPTYYFETPEDGVMTPESDGPAGDGRYEGIKGNYYKEVLEDLIPQIESRFNVYCEDFSPEGIAASRDHRAWAGYSRGSSCTWYMFHHNLAYFKWWMPMSATVRIDNVPMGTETTDEDAYQYLKESIDAHPDLDFFIFAASGGAEDAASMRTLMKYLVGQTDTFSYGTNPAVNNIYYTCSDLSHNMLYSPYYLYNAKDVLFH